MIKGIIFDLDGVLVDTKDIHFQALNEALLYVKAKNIISYDDHAKNFDGLPTTKKLRILEKRSWIKKNQIEKIKQIKQKLTLKILKKKIKKNNQLIKLFYSLKNKYKIGVATNAVRSTLDICLNNLGLKKYIDFSISNEEVLNSKPHPEIYLRSLIKLDLKPKETLIIEDSYFGRKAAQESGCHLYPVKSLKEVNLTNINRFLKLMFLDKTTSITKWVDPKLNILIPMAGEGSRFREAGFFFPKPIIEVLNKPMIQWVIESLNIDANYIFLIQKKHQEKFNIKSMLKLLQPNCKIIEIDKITEGAACTTLLAKKYINNNEPLIIANSDQYIKWNSSQSIYNFITRKIDGSILTFNSIHPKWSYAKCDENLNVVKVAEKEVISNNATVGVYFWKKGSDYVKYANQMIKKNIRVNNEFYVCPVFNEAIKDSKIIKIEKVDEMHGLGTPEDLSNFLSFLQTKNS
jgi:HAD superfamily hydrolase (TIGR01509 family)